MIFVKALPIFVAAQMYITNTTSNWSGPVPFTGNPGVAADLNVRTPVDCFLKLFDMSVLEHIHRETVRYLEQYLEDNKEYLEEHPKARVHKLARHPITLDDIKAFIAIIIGMGICGFPSKFLSCQHTIN